MLKRGEAPKQHGNPLEEATEGFIIMISLRQASVRLEGSRGYIEGGRRLEITGQVSKPRKPKLKGEDKPATISDCIERRRLKGSIETGTQGRQHQGRFIGKGSREDCQSGSDRSGQGSGRKDRRRKKTPGLSPSFLEEHGPSILACPPTCTAMSSIWSVARATN